MMRGMLRSVTAFTLFLAFASCVTRTAATTPVVFKPSSTAEAAETARQTANLLQTVPLESFEPHLFHTSTGLTVPYRLLRPDSDAGRGPHPLVVIFHGSGAIGADNRAQIGPLARSWAADGARAKFPAFVLVPQFPARTVNYTIGTDSLPHSVGTELLSAGIELVHHIRATEHVAKGKTYALGFSMGGSAIWQVLRREPGLFSRAVIVGGVPTADAVQTIGATRVLLIHGAEDDENPFAAAWKVFESSNGAIELWRFDGLGHEFPPELIATHRLREWLFQP
jgi:predicted peptidase